MTIGHRLRSGSARRGFAVLSAAALLSTMIAAPALATHRANTTSLTGSNAIEAALAWSDATFTTASAVVIGRDDVFADNLASGLIQGLGTGVPLLLTDSATLDSAVSAEITSLGATVAHILGGNTAISPAVEAALVAKGMTVHRHAGASRVETAVDIAEKHGGTADTVILARAFGASATDASQAFADALAAGAWAAETGWPILLTQTASLHPAVDKFLDDSTTVTKVKIVGGTSAVSAAVAADLQAAGLTVDRVSGATRFETATAVAKARGFDDAGDAVDGTVLIEGQDADSWAAGFAGAAYSGAVKSRPIVLSNGGALPAPTAAFLNGQTGSLVCGPMVVAAACDAASSALGNALTPHTNQTFTVTPADAATLTVSEGTTTNANRGARAYTISGLGSATSIDIALFPAENVTNTAGQITLKDTDNTANQADWAATSGIFEVVNGVAVADTDGFIDNVAPSGGTIAISVDATTSDEVIPVAFVNTAVNTAPVIALGTDDKPTPAFGVGGTLNWIPTETLGGTVEVGAPGFTAVNKTAKYMIGSITAHQTGAEVGNSRTLEYDSNDNFQISGVPTTLANFEANLSKGDTLLTGTIYAPDPAAVSTFNLGDVSPTGPATVTATTVDEDTITVTWTAVTGVDTYNVYRRALAAGACGLTLTDYVKVGSVAGTLTTFTDNGLTAATRYCYVVTSVTDGDESTALDDGDDTTSAAGTTAAPQSTTIVATTDAGFPNEGDVGDVWRFVFTKAVTVAGTAVVRVQDAGGQFNNATCGTELTCSLNTEVVVIGSTEYAIGRVLTATVAAGGLPIDGDADGNTANNDGVLNYPLTVVNASGITDGTRSWDPAASPDKTIEVNTLADAIEDTPHLITAAVTTGAADWNATGDVLTLTFSEAVDWQPAGTSLTQAQVRALTGSTTVTFAGTTTVTIAGSCLTGAGAVCTLTIGVAGMTTGILTGASLSGTVNSELKDVDDGNQQQIAGTAVTVS